MTYILVTRRSDIKVFHYPCYCRNLEELPKCENWSSSLSIGTRHEAIMFQKLSIMLLDSAQKITYYAFKKMPLIPKIMPLTLANNVHL